MPNRRSSNPELACKRGRGLPRAYLAVKLESLYTYILRRWKMAQRNFTMGVLKASRASLLSS